MTLKVTKDTVWQVLASIQRLVRQEVLVGIPADKAEREDGDPINNAQLGYIHEYGSPAQNIPARPFLEPGVALGSEQITARMKNAAKAAIDGNSEKVDDELNQAGQIGAAGARYQINHGEFEPLNPSTVRRRKKVRGTKSTRAAEKKYLELIASGSTPEQAQEEAGVRPLINTGQLRNSLTYVIRKKE
ncbi:hypothetical protein G5B91_17925 [Pseudomonas nitroreducens]|uniref:Bacteriophage protein n=2 Tax=Pseudomonas nitroreducens TaxID=46680 RepID=A0A6G6IYK9_PSENT|nr:hypothetical protein [Pseudomonas nitroreducens]QIE88047.1 hypothetical protein G5B91_17925 [Pseudomonas nitroreducens]